MLLMQAAYDGDLQRVQELLKSGANVDQKDYVMREDGLGSRVGNGVHRMCSSCS